METLQANLEDLGVEFNPIPTDELVQQLSQERINWLAHLLGGFLHHVKSANLSRAEIESRAQNARDRKRTQRFLQVFHEVRERYQQLLAQEKAIDFHDLINQAAEIMRGDGWKSPFTHVMVDEFQGISEGRIAMLESLRKEGLAYFLVRDDWQSIYRFAGSQVGLVHDCYRHLGHTERRALTRTFWFGPNRRHLEQPTRRETPDPSRHSPGRHGPMHQPNAHDPDERANGPADKARLHTGPHKAGPGPVPGVQVHVLRGPEEAAQLPDRPGQPRGPISNLQLLCDTYKERKSIQTNKEFYARYRKDMREVRPGQSPRAPIPLARFREETGRTQAHDGSGNCYGCSRTPIPTPRICWHDFSYPIQGGSVTPSRGHCSTE